MSQYRKGKGLSLGQTVNNLQWIANNAYEHRTTARAARYHIEKLRGKLHRLNLKIQREAVCSQCKDADHDKRTTNCKLPFSMCLDCRYHNCCARYTEQDKEKHSGY